MMQQDGDHYTIGTVGDGTCGLPNPFHKIVRAHTVAIIASMIEEDSKLGCWSELWAGGVVVENRVGFDEFY